MHYVENPHFLYENKKDYMIGEKHGNPVVYHNMQLTASTIEVEKPYLKLKSIELGPKVKIQWKKSLDNLLARKEWYNVIVKENEHSEFFRTHNK